MPDECWTGRETLDVAVSKAIRTLETLTKSMALRQLKAVTYKLDEKTKDRFDLYLSDAKAAVEDVANALEQNASLVKSTTLHQLVSTESKESLTDHDYWERTEQKLRRLRQARDDNQSKQRRGHAARRTLEMPADVDVCPKPAGGAAQLLRYLEHGIKARTDQIEGFKDVYSRSYQSPAVLIQFISCFLYMPVMRRLLMALASYRGNRRSTACSRTSRM